MHPQKSWGTALKQTVSPWQGCFLLFFSWALRIDINQWYHTPAAKGSFSAHKVKRHWLLISSPWIPKSSSDWVIFPGIHLGEKPVIWWALTHSDMKQPLLPPFCPFCLFLLTVLGHCTSSSVDCMAIPEHNRCPSALLAYCISWVGPRNMWFL